MGVSEHNTSTNIRIRLPSNQNFVLFQSKLNEIVSNTDINRNSVNSFENIG